MPELSLFDSSQVMMICPPDLYQVVACTPGMKEDRKASPCCTEPSCSSLIRFGVYQTKSGALALLRSVVSLEASAMEGLPAKYSQGKWRTAYSPESLAGLAGRFSAYALC